MDVLDRGRQVRFLYVVADGELAIGIFDPCRGTRLGGAHRVF